MTDLKKILVIDDDDFILNLLERRLTEENGYIFKYAHHGRDALIMTEKEEFDIILTDIIMPVKDGIAFMTDFRKANKKTPIIAMSGGPEGENATEFLEFADYFANSTLKKPFSSQELFDVLNDALNQTSADVLKWL